MSHSPPEFSARPRRRSHLVFLTVLAAISILFLTIHSYGSPLFLPVTTPAGNTYRLSVEQGHLRLLSQRVTLSTPSAPGYFDDPSTLTYNTSDPGQLIVFRKHQRIGLLTFPDSSPRPDPFVFGYSHQTHLFRLSTNGPAVTLVYHSLAIPPWPFLLLVFTPCLIRAARTLYATLRPRPGCCTRCGYDLRATPDRCPECGSQSPAPAS